MVSPEPTGDGSILYARPGDQITYRIAFDNKDNDYAVSKIVIVDALPQQVQFVSATSDGLFGSYDRGTHTYTWVWPSLGPRAAASVDLTVRLAENVPAGAVITNRATIKSDQTPQEGKDTDITVAFSPLEVEKTAVSPAGETDDRGRPRVGAGEQVTYKIRFRNPSRDVAVTQITILDKLPPEMTFVSAEGDRDFGSYNSVSHTFAWQYPLLAAGGDVSLQLVVQVKEAVEPNVVVSNMVTVTSKQAAPSQARARCGRQRGSHPGPDVLQANPNLAEQLQGHAGPDDDRTPARGLRHGQDRGCAAHVDAGQRPVRQSADLRLQHAGQGPVRLRYGPAPGGHPGFRRIPDSSHGQAAWGAVFRLRRNDLHPEIRRPVSLNPRAIAICGGPVPTGKAGTSARPRRGMKNGEGGIRTRGTVNSTLVFETSSISRSDTSPSSLTSLFPKVYVATDVTLCPSF